MRGRLDTFFRSPDRRFDDFGTPALGFAGERTTLRHSRATFIAEVPTGNNRIGSSYVGHNYIGHSCTDHDCRGHTYIWGFADEGIALRDSPIALFVEVPIGQAPTSVDPSKF